MIMISTIWNVEGMRIPELWSLHQSKFYGLMIVFSLFFLGYSLRGSGFVCFRISDINWTLSDGTGEYKNWTVVEFDVCVGIILILVSD